jgi:predicted helicase
MVDWPRPEVLGHMLQNNLALIANRQSKEQFGAFVADKLTERKIAAVYDASTTFPLYLYPSETDLDQTRRVNFDPKIHKTIIEAVAGPSRQAARPPQGDPARQAALAPQDEGRTPDEVAIFDYIYGVLHCPAYRETYREFLKIDFPRVPYPPSPEVFWDVSAKGTALRKLHLMEEAAIGETPYKFTGAGDSVVGKVEYDGGVVRINKTQGFEGVPEIAWNFHIGGYQPAQKWLKDRKGRALSFDDIRHYQKIIKILSETDRIMKTITMPLDGAK